MRRIGKWNKDSDTILKQKKGKHRVASLQWRLYSIALPASSDRCPGCAQDHQGRSHTLWAPRGWTWAAETRTAALNFHHLIHTHNKYYILTKYKKIIWFSFTHLKPHVGSGESFTDYSNAQVSKIAYILYQICLLPKFCRTKIRNSWINKCKNETQEQCMNLHLPRLPFHPLRYRCLEWTPLIACSRRPPGRSRIAPLCGCNDHEYSGIELRESEYLEPPGPWQPILSPQHTITLFP